MIVGIGIDLVEIARIERIYKKFQQHFLKKFFRQIEIEDSPAYFIPYIAGRFAAKEAVVKALGIGFRDGIGPRQIEVLANAYGQPVLTLYDNALMHDQKLGIKNYHISISHERGNAVAIVIMEA